MKKLLVKVSVITLVLSSLGCAGISRHPASGYGGYGGYGNETPLMMTSDEAYQLDPNSRRIASLGPNQRSQLNDRLALIQMEKGIRGIEERRLYYRYRDRMEGDQERLYFLELPTYASKENYLKKRGLHIDDVSYTEEMEKLIAENDISVGMPMKAVEESWGIPRSREVSGHEMLGNERWHFTKYVKSIEGYKREDRIVIFEGGLVKGWETN